MENKTQFKNELKELLELDHYQLIIGEVDGLNEAEAFKVLKNAKFDCDEEADSFESQAIQFFSDKVADFVAKWEQ